MDVLNHIVHKYENVKNALKKKLSSDRRLCLKKEIQSINNDLVVFANGSNSHYIRSLAMGGYLAYLTAKTLTEDIVEANNILQVAFEKLKEYALREECLYILLKIQNLLCYTLIQLNQFTQAREILESIEVLYERISKLRSDKFLDAEDLFTVENICNIVNVNPAKIDKVITNNIQMQAYLYNKLNLPDKYTVYCYTTLLRQLELKDSTPQEWALRAARLGTYFTYLNQMENARHHLCAAYHVLRTCHDNCKLIPEEFVLKKAEFEMHFLELSHHWVKFGLALFKLSKKVALNKFFSSPSSKAHISKSVDMLDENVEHTEKYEEDKNVKDQGADKTGNIRDTDIKNNFTFSCLNLTLMESRTPVETVSGEEDARTLFAFTHKWLMRVKHFYDFEHHPAQYISCTLQLAELYEHLAFFESNIDSQYGIQRRRADVLETLNSLLQTCDNVVSVQIDVIKELSQVQLEMMTLNLQKLWHEESKTDVANVDLDADSIILSLETDSNKALAEKTTDNCKNTILRKLEAASSLNSKLFRLNERFESHASSSQFSLATSVRESCMSSNFFQRDKK